MAETRCTKKMLLSMKMFPTVHIILSTYKFLLLWSVNSGITFKEVTEEEEKRVVTSCRTMPWAHKENFSVAALNR
jgi:hypothetical protein